MQALKGKVSGAVVAGALALAGCALAGCAQTSLTGSTRAAATPPSALGSGGATSTVVPLSATAATPADGEVHDKGAAQARGAADLDAVRLPATAVRASSAPDPQLTVPPQTTYIETMVDDSRWFTVPTTTSSAVLDFVKAHPPMQTDNIGGSSGSDDVSAVMFMSAGNDHNEIDISTVQDGSSVAVRVDAQVTWLPAKAAADTIPAGVSSAQLAYHGGLQQPGQPKPVDRTVTVTGPQLVGLVAAINGLEIVPPGPPHSCPMDDGETATLSVPDSDVSFAIAMSGCRFVTVSTGARQGDTLTEDGGTDLSVLVHAIAGVTPSPSTAPKPSS